METKSSILFQADMSSLGAVERLFRDFDSDVRKKIAGPAFREIGKFVLGDAQRRVPVKTGKLRNSLTYRMLTETKDGSLGVRVFARRSKAFPHGYLAHLVEFGSRVVVVRGFTGSGLVKQVIGFQPARPFIRPAVEANRNLIMARLSENIAERLSKYEKKMAKVA